MKLADLTDPDGRDSADIEEWVRLLGRDVKSVVFVWEGYTQWLAKNVYGLEIEDLMALFFLFS